MKWFGFEISDLQTITSLVVKPFKSKEDMEKEIHSFQPYVMNVFNPFIAEDFQKAIDKIKNKWYNYVIPRGKQDD